MYVIQKSSLGWGLKENSPCYQSPYQPGIWLCLRNSSCAHWNSFHCCNCNWVQSQVAGCNTHLCRLCGAAQDKNLFSMETKDSTIWMEHTGSALASPCAVCTQKFFALRLFLYSILQHHGEQGWIHVDAATTVLTKFTHQKGKTSSPVACRRCFQTIVVSPLKTTNTGEDVPRAQVQPPFFCSSKRIRAVRSHVCGTCAWETVHLCPPVFF